MFEKCVDDSGRKPNKIWVDQDSEFYYRSLKSRLHENGIEIYSTHNEEISVVAERFIRTLKNKIYMHMTAASKNAYIDKLDEKVEKYSNTYHRTIRNNPVDVKSDKCLEYVVEHNNKYLKFKICNHVRKSKYKNMFANGFTPNWFKEVVVKKAKTTVASTYVISDLKREEIVGTFYEKEMQRQSLKTFGLKK